MSVETTYSGGQICRRKLGELTPEDEFLMFGHALREPPPLFTWRSQLGVLANSALDRLLAKVESNDIDAEPIGAILASCAAPLEDRPLSLSNLAFLNAESWEQVVHVLALARATQGLRPEDFEDDGARFTRLVASRLISSNSTNAPTAAVRP